MKFVVRLGRLVNRLPFRKFEKFAIVRQRTETNGVIYTVEAGNIRKEIRVTFHCIDRAKKWDIPMARLLETLLFPQEVLIGHSERFIAHRRYRGRIVRAVYEYEGLRPVVITVYFPKAERYFRGGGHYADKILP